MASELPAGANAPDRLGTQIPQGGFASDPEKQQISGKPKVPVDDDDEDIEDIDALIDDLESQDGNEDFDDESAAPGSSARPVPEDLLQTDTRTGLTSAEVDQRRKKYGLNQMKEEKENLVLKFLMYFVGPIQFVMEVSFPRSCVLCALRLELRLIDSFRLLPFSLPVFRIGLISVSSALFSCSTPVSVSSRSSRLVLSSTS
jgi:magnesium-transporting ATPase (P-type)